MISGAGTTVDVFDMSNPSQVTGFFRILPPTSMQRDFGRIAHTHHHLLSRPDC